MFERPQVLFAAGLMTALRIDPVPDRASCRGARSTSLAIAGGLLSASLVGPCGAAVDASAPPPIRVVRIGHGDVSAMKQNIAASVEACRIVKKLGAGAVALPPDSVLSQFGVLETEELFNGAQWATYETQRSITADAVNGCKLAVFIHRSATVEQSCEWRVRGSNALLGAMTNFESPAPSTPMVEDDKLAPQTCSSRKRAADDTAGLPSEDAGAGARCVWSSALLAPRDGEGRGACRPGQAQRHRQQHRRRHVPLRKAPALRGGRHAPPGGACHEGRVARA